MEGMRQLCILEEVDEIPNGMLIDGVGGDGRGDGNGNIGGVGNGDDGGAGGEKRCWWC